MPLNDIGAVDALTLGKNVSPPSSDAVKRVYQPRPSGLSRRSYQTMPTTPWPFTATAGMKSFGPPDGFAGPSSMATGEDEVFPVSSECDNHILWRLSSFAAHTT